MVIKWCRLIILRGQSFNEARNDMAGSFIIGDSRTVGEAGTQGVEAKVTKKSAKTGKVITRAENLGGNVKHTNTAKGRGNDGNYYYASGGQGYNWFSKATEESPQATA